jgi:hypothetical protein
VFRYTPDLYQDPSINGLPPLVVPDNTQFPKRILYPVDYLPLANPAAEAILQSFIANLTRIFGMEVQTINYTATVEAVADPVSGNFPLLSAALVNILTYTQWNWVAQPLITTWGSLFEGRFPPVDVAQRTAWRSYNQSAFTSTPAGFAQAIGYRAEAVAWSDRNLLSATDSCSENLFLYDIGTGGLPSYREQDLITNNPAATLLGLIPPDAKISQSLICPLYGWYVRPLKY